jgi:hypothetical protein
MIAAPVAAGELRGAQSTEFSSQGVYIEARASASRVGRDRDRDRLTVASWLARPRRCAGTAADRDGARDAAERHDGFADPLALLSSTRASTNLAPFTGAIFLCPQSLLQVAR